MSKVKLVSGLLLLAAAGAVVLVFQRATEQRAAAVAAEAAAAARAEGDRVAAEQAAVEKRVKQATDVKPLNAALEDHVDGATLVDLFDNEEWWQPFRSEFAGVHVIVGDSVLAARGQVDLVGKDTEVVKAARLHRFASARMVVGDQHYLIAAARLSALPDREPVLVLTKKVAPPPPPRPTVARPSPLTDRRIPWAAGGALGVAGLALVLAGMRRRGGAGAVVMQAIPKEPTLKFGTNPVPRRSVTSADAQFPIPGATGARPPLASGSAVSIPGTGPGVGAVPSAPAAGTAVLAVAEPPGTFGRYKLLDRLGEGGMSEIFTAETSGVEGFSRTFVLKRLRPELSRDKEAVAQFIDEARLQAGLVHSNIVPVFDFGNVGGEYFLTQEYIAGRDVSRLMARYQQVTGRTSLEPRLAFYIAYETLQALAYAHGRRDKNGAPMGIVHRDVSAGNIIMSLQGEVKLSDFGIVKSNRRVTKTQVGMVKGNANFMSPEQARGMSVDCRSDLFSLGQVLYFCLTNQLLYSGDNDLDVLYKAATGPTLEDYRRMHDLPDPAGQILEKALAFDPGQRFQNAEEFGGVLAAHMGGGKAAAAALMQVLFGEELRNEAA